MTNPRTCRKSKATRFIRLTGLIILLGVYLPGCMDPAFYEDPSMESGPLGYLVDVETPIEDMVEVQNTPDQESAKTLELGNETGVPAGDITLGNIECWCNFSVAIKDSVPHSVWLTGNFVLPAWPLTPATGAVEMEFSNTEQEWEAAIRLRTGWFVEYKFLVRDSAESEVVPRNQEGKLGSAITASSFLVVCGDGFCDEAPPP